jgi:type IV secretory pathway TrbD component
MLSDSKFAEAASDVASKVAIGSGSAAVVGGLSLNEWLAIGGFVIAIISLGVNIYYRQRMLNIAREKSKQ